MKNIVSHKIVVSGSVVELFSVVRPAEKMCRAYKYDRPMVQGTDIRLDNLRRTKSRLMRLIRCNPDMTRFITLTFGIDVRDLSVAHSYFRQFIQKMKYRYIDLPFKYIAVPEYQSGGRVHYHILCNIPYLENSLLESIWGRGFTFIEKTYGSIDAIAHYLSDYLTLGINAKFFSRRRFFYSLTCLKPRIFETTDYLQVLFFVSQLELVCKQFIDIGYGVELHYYRYRVPAGKKLNLPLIDKTLTPKKVPLKLKDQRAKKPLPIYPQACLPISFF